MNTCHRWIEFSRIKFQLIWKLQIVNESKRSLLSSGVESWNHCLISLRLLLFFSKMKDYSQNSTKFLFQKMPTEVPRRCNYSLHTISTSFQIFKYLYQWWCHLSKVISVLIKLIKQMNWPFPAWNQAWFIIWQIFISLLFITI